MKDNIAVVTPSGLDQVNETFILAHARHIENARLYYGGKIPYYLENDTVDFNPSSFLDKIKVKVLGQNPEQIQIKKLISSFRQNKIKAVLAEYGDTGAHMMKVCKEANIPLFVHFHGYDASLHTILSKYKSEYEEMFQFATAIFVVSNFMKKKLISLGCPEDKLVLNIYGPNPRFLDHRNTPDTKKFVAISGFRDKKAPYYTLLAFKKVLEKHPDVRLVWGGSGELKPTTENLAKFYGIDKKIEFKGFLNPDQVFETMQGANCFIQHSIIAENGDTEGTPVAIIEAQAMGVPVVSTRHAGIPDVVLENETGYLCDEHDVHEMAECMLKIIEDPDKTIQLAGNAKSRIMSEFTMEQHIDRIIKKIENSI
jgi:colanic acid/amylovoran biosynthesis glycosyltransferase